MYKDGKWAKEILNQQRKDGSFGWFHSLSSSSGTPLTTEMALRRLERLGYGKEDTCIQKALSYMHACLIGEIKIPDREEKVQDWPVFCRMILAAWICRFTDEDSDANRIAEQWTQVITESFKNGRYNDQVMQKAYCDTFHTSSKSGRLIRYSNFYPISLMAGRLDVKTEERMLDDLIQRVDGIYYVYDHRIMQLPAVFQSRDASRYLAALELLGRYPGARGKLQFAVDWLNEMKNESGHWDMGTAVNDKVYFPLSDDWRKKENRIKDCTLRIEHLLNKLQ